MSSDNADESANTFAIRGFLECAKIPRCNAWICFSKTPHCCSKWATEDLIIVVEASRTSSASFTCMLIGFGVAKHALFARYNTSLQAVKPYQQPMLTHPSHKIGRLAQGLSNTSFVHNTSNNVKLYKDALLVMCGTAYQQGQSAFCICHLCGLNQK